MEHKAWVISADMGYGHQRAAYPLKDIANERIITANSDKLISKKEEKIWARARYFYEWVSRMNSIPLIGKALFKIVYTLQKISPYYPFRDLSRPTFTVLYIHKKIKKGLNEALVNYMKTTDLPIISTFFISTLAADYHGLKRNYCVITDTDLHRLWVAKNPKESNIIYFAPCEKAVRRLKEYGVAENRIYLTGFPLPKENIGGIEMPILKQDIEKRLVNLDPNHIFLSRYEESIKKHLGINQLPTHSDHALTITFMIGGAGAQTEYGLQLLESLRKKLADESLHLNLAAGTRMEVYELFLSKVKELDLEPQLGKSINIIRALTKKEYFEAVNLALRTTDILWTKPSELVFYGALGLPLIITPPLGYHENTNLTWAEHLGMGFAQYDPRYANEWLYDWLSDGRLADAAWNGFLEAPKLGTYEIERIVFEEKNLDTV